MLDIASLDTFTWNSPSNQMSYVLIDLSAVSLHLVQKKLTRL